jgi:type I restriction enzyme S subunit
MSAFFKTLPASWRCQKLKHVADFRVSNVDKLSNELEEPIRLCNYTDVYHREFISPDLPLMEATATTAEIQKFLLKAGDVVITKDSESWDDIAVPALVESSAPDMVCGYHLAMIRGKERELDGRFLFRCFQSGKIRSQLEVEAKGVTRYGLPNSAIGETLLPLPPLPAQRRIAAYLDRETAQIDALVAEKETLLELLEEKRASLISHAVTRGLNPKAKLKPSGIPWLGDVPVHWEVKRIKNLANIIRGKFTYRPRNAPHLYNGPFPFIQTGDVARADKYITSHTQTLSEAGYEVSKEFSKGTLCMTIAANVGDVAILEFDACFPDSVVGFRPSSSNSVDYLYYLFLSLRPQLLETSVVSTQANLNIDRVGTLKVAVPPLDEQRITAAFLAKLDKGTSQLRSEIQTSITLLREKRSSLISAAVTGEMAVP